MIMPNKGYRTSEGSADRRSPDFPHSHRADDSEPDLEDLENLAQPTRQRCRSPVLLVRARPRHTVCARCSAVRRGHPVQGEEELMLCRLGSNEEQFKSLIFRPGVNILLADKMTRFNDNDSRHGAGKSSMIEILHFLFGMKKLTGSVFGNPALQSETFTLSMERPDARGSVTITRSVAKKSRVRLFTEAVGPRTLPGSPNNLSSADWVEALGRDLFGFPEEHRGISSRALLSLYIRRVSQHGLDDPVRTHPKQLITEATTNVAYLLGLDWRLARGYQELADRESLRRKLKQTTRDPVLNFMVGTVSELRGPLTAATQRVRALENQVHGFRVVPEYERLQERADQIDARLRGTRDHDAVDRRNLQDLEAAVREEHEPDTEYLRRAYRELGIDGNSELNCPTPSCNGTRRSGPSTTRSLRIVAPIWKRRSPPLGPGCRTGSTNGTVWGKSTLGC
ncbi:MAG: hypothetical protein QG608_362 [Actinomycetota bacterium]|nr:hypothetical protein [Actinomycetota bacterium]